MCPPMRLLITSAMIWTPYDRLNKFYSCYMATIVIIITKDSAIQGALMVHRGIVSGKRVNLHMIVSKYWLPA